MTKKKDLLDENIESLENKVIREKEFNKLLDKIDKSIEEKKKRLTILIVSLLFIMFFIIGFMFYNLVK